MSLNIPHCTHTKAFRALEKALKGDAVLSRCVKTWSTWCGTQADRLEPALGLVPMIQLTPARGGDKFYGPSSFIGPLVVHVGLAVAGTNADDLFDLYQLIVNALYPSDQAVRETIRQKLVTAGADTGEATFTQPRFGVGVDEENTFLIAAGQIQLDLRTLMPS